MCVTAAADESTHNKAHAPSSSTPEQPWGERQRRSSDASDRDSGTVARILPLLGSVGTYEYVARKVHLEEKTVGCI